MNEFYCFQRVLGSPILVDGTDRSHGGEFMIPNVAICLKATYNWSLDITEIEKGLQREQQGSSLKKNLGAP